MERGPRNYFQFLQLSQKCTAMHSVHSENTNIIFRQYKSKEVIICRIGMNHCLKNSSISLESLWFSVLHSKRRQLQLKDAKNSKYKSTTLWHQSRKLVSRRLFGVHFWYISTLFVGEKYTVVSEKCHIEFEMIPLVCSMLLGKGAFLT